VAYLAAKGYRPVAVTGSPENAQWLTSIGATSVIAHDEVTDHPGRVLGTDRWDGAIDCVGGETLSAILRSLRYGAAVAASGLVGGNEVHTTVYPFIIRANALLGIDAVQTSHEKRQRVWAALAEVRPLVDLEVFVDAEVSLAGVAESLERVLAGKTRGRVLVHPAS
jgi:putative YhdH/YhfP family quinone oxidoreductase